MRSSDGTTTSLLHVINFRAIPMLVGALMLAASIPILIGHSTLVEKLGPGRLAEVYETYYWISVWTGLAVGLALLIGSLTYWLIARAITRPLSEMANRAIRLTQSCETSRFRTDSPIREIQQISSSFNRLFEAQERRVRELTELVHAVMHDLHTPLSHIRNAADLVLKCPSEHTEAAVTLIDACDTISDIIDANTEISLHYSHGDTTPASRQDLSAIVNTGIDIFSGIADSKSIRLSASLPPAPVIVQAHKAKLQSLVSNLLENALKYTPAGGNVSLVLSHSNAQVRLAVSDTGCGISEHDLPHIFERFYRADFSRHEPGSGLGLALVHSIVTFYSGTIDCQSTPGKGTTFTVTLPLTAETAEAKDARPTKSKMPCS